MVHSGHFRLRQQRRRRDEAVETGAASPPGFVEKVSGQNRLQLAKGDDPAAQNRFGPAGFHWREAR